MQKWKRYNPSKIEIMSAQNDWTTEMFLKVYSKTLVCTELCTKPREQTKLGHSSDAPELNSLSDFPRNRTDRRIRAKFPNRKLQQLQWGTTLSFHLLIVLCLCFSQPFSAYKTKLLCLAHQETHLIA
jgi:hypothetical protein